MTNLENKQKNIKDIIGSIEKEYGPGAAKYFSTKYQENISCISTGSLCFNEIIGSNGYPKGRIIEIFGPEGSGKTTLGLEAVKECQKSGGICAYIDTEHSLNSKYINELGVNPDELIISQPDSGEQAFSIIYDLLKTQQVELIVLDSVAALVPMAELESQMFEHQMGAQARLVAKGLRKINHLMSKSKTCIIFINQLREKVGVIYGNPEITPGGRALKFFSSLRIDIRKREDVKLNGVSVGNYVDVKIIKNKIGNPFSKTKLKLIFGKGIDKDEDFINFAISKNIIVKKASWYYFDNKMIAQGMDRLKTKLQNDSELFTKIKQKF